MMEQVENVAQTTIEAAMTETASEDAENARDMTEEPAQTREGTEAVNDAEEAQTSGESAEDGRIFTPVYNGAVMPVKASDTARVTTLLQKGMKFEHMADDLERLHQLKTMCGAKTIGDAIGMLLAEKEHARLAEYEQMYGQEAAEKLLGMEKRQSGSFREADAATDRASKEALGARLSAEFRELQKDYPAIVQASQLPEEVIALAVQKGIPLLDAYNRYTLKEQKRVMAATQQHRHNQKAATGSLADRSSEVSDPVWEAFLRGARH